MCIVEEEFNPNSSGKIQNEIRDAFSYFMEQSEKLIHFSKYSFLISVIILYNKRRPKVVV